MLINSNTTLMTDEIPCYEVAQSASEGEVLRFRGKDPTKGFSTLTLSTKDTAFKGQVSPGKTYKVTIEEVKK